MGRGKKDIVFSLKGYYLAATGGFWTRVRGHEPVRSDGVTPLTTDFEVGDTDIWTFTVGLKYYL